MFLTLIAFLFTISVLVFVHEMGHFLAAKKSGIKVEEFGFGIPPRVWGKKVGETVYSLNLLPIGGFVKLFGEERDTKREIHNTKYIIQDTEYKRAFWAKSKRTRVVVVTAGVLMNVLLAVFAFWVIYMGLGIPSKTDKVMVVGVIEGSPAAEAGIKVDDVVVEVEGEEIESVDHFIEIVEENKGKGIEMTLGRRSGEDTSDGGPPIRWNSREVEEFVKVQVAPRQDPPEDEGPLGVVISQVEPKFFPFWQMPFVALRESLKETFGWAIAVSGGVAQMVWQLIRTGQAPKDIAGPIGIFQVTGMVARQGIYSVLQFLGILSVNLAVINILPFPPLDGGKLLFIGIEGVFGRKVTPKIEKWTQNFGVILLLLLMLWITINDISRFLSPVKPF